MWGLKFLNGPLAGQIVPLKVGGNRIGRSTSADLQLSVPGVSKDHVEIMVAADKILINDLQSSNGTFLNGVRIKGALAKPGDKISIHNVLLEIVPYSGSRVLALPRTGASHVPARAGNGQNALVPGGSGAAVPGHFVGQQQYEQPLMNLTEPEAGPPPPPPPQNLAGHVQNVIQKSQDFVESVALPGVYNLPRVFDFKQVILGFIGIYIILVTLLSIVPMKQITSESIQNESLRRAITVARSLAAANEKILRSNDLSSFSTDMVLREEGIEDVYIVSKEGMIVAPPERTGSAPRETGFVRKVRGQPREYSEELGTGQIAAAVPVLVFDPELQQNTAKAHAIVVYNPGNLAFDDGRAFSLFVQMLFLAFIIGGILFFFLYKLIEHPFKLLNNELDQALREGRDQASIDFNLPVLQNLMTNVNSLLARAAAGSAPQMAVAGKGARDQEIFNLMQLIGYPCILIARDTQVVRLNSAFEGLTGMTSDKVVGSKISEIPDPAMQQNFQHLMNQADVNMSRINSDNLELSGHLFTLSCQAISSVGGDIEYYLITIMPAQTAEGGAA
ncbi:MAG: FHA domain-containing protein [Bdellovibrio sp.]|jgi:PAS domain S-box-containing protein